MSGTAAPISYARAAEQVKDLIGQGTHFTQVEEAIDAAHTPREHKAALWLLAWSISEPKRQREHARRTPGLIGTGAWGDR